MPQAVLQKQKCRFRADGKIAAHGIIARTLPPAGGGHAARSESSKAFPVNETTPSGWIGGSRSDVLVGSGIFPSGTHPFAANGTDRHPPQAPPPPPPPPDTTAPAKSRAGTVG